jgi:DNA mismatch repair protein MutL
MPIQILSKQLANQIAAGEVIEGPMSVVKECVENAIDAQATQITIILEKGGHSKIQIVDNGIGMDRSDLEKCILPHATSKISEYQDLHAISTLGFRGEALASIASVAELTIISKTKDMEHAFQGHAKPTPTGCDTLWAISPASHGVGTTVCVEDLFYLTPARKKFMKSQASDLKKIIEWIEILALTQWDVSFTVISEGKQKLHLPIAHSWERIEMRMASILGDTFVKHSKYIDHKASGMRLHGWICMPQYDRGRPDQQYTFVNHRSIKDKIIMKAVKEAYQKLLFHGRHPAYALYLECDPAMVDVNVHPTKSEVRFADSRSIFQLIQTTLTQELREVPVYVHDRREELSVSLALQDQPSQDQPPRVSQDVVLEIDPTIARPYQPFIMQPKPYVLKAPVADYQLRLNLDQVALCSEDEREIKKTMDVAKVNTSVKPSLGQAIAQCHHRYILAQNEEGFIVVDQHAAHERILFEKLKHQSSLQTAKQKLLMPEEIVLESFDAPLAIEFTMQLQALGFEVDILHETLRVQAVPIILKDISLTSAIQESWHIWVQEEAREDRMDYLMDRVLANMACKSAIKANYPLSITQMNVILRDMESIPYGGLCNHGRPAVRFFDLATMDQWFLRGQ